MKKLILILLISIALVNCSKTTESLPIDIATKDMKIQVDAVSNSGTITSSVAVSIQ